MSVYVTWLPHLWCNFDRVCPYCYMHGHKDFPGPRGKSLPVADWMAWFDRLMDSREILVNLTGGEPTAYPGLEQVLQRVSDRGSHFYLCSNMTFAPERFTSMAGMSALWCSFHNVRNAAWRKEFIRRVAICKAAVDKLPGWREVIVNIVHQEGWEIALAEATEALKPLGVDIRSQTEDPTYRDHQTVPIQSTGRAKACSAGMDTLCAWSDGKIYRCFAHAFLGINSIGSIYDGTLPLAAPTPCDFVRCTSCDLGQLSVLEIER